MDGVSMINTRCFHCCAARSGNARPAVDSPVHPCARHAARPARLIFNAVFMLLYYAAQLAVEVICRTTDVLQLALRWSYPSIPLHCLFTRCGHTWRDWRPSPLLSEPPHQSWTPLMTPAQLSWQPRTPRSYCACDSRRPRDPRDSQREEC